MELSDFDYPLPKELIAQEPARERSGSRLLFLGKDNGIQDMIFTQLDTIARKGDLFVINTTKVSPAKLAAKKETGGVVTLLIKDRMEDGTCTALIAGKKIRPGQTLTVENNIQVEIVSHNSQGEFTVRFESQEILESIMQASGKLPLPPYIKKEQDDISRYQTVYADSPGAIAAPTAGLHFTPDVMKAVEKKGAGFAKIDLTVGYGTFKPVRANDVVSHRMETEKYSISRDSATIINRALEDKMRVIPVGTTCMRALESSAMRGMVVPGANTTNLFIYPGYNFRLKYSGFLTNFHMPKSSLILLASAYAGRERLLGAYSHAMEKRYRFLSLGDAMFIEGEPVG